MTGKWCSGLKKILSPFWTVLFIGFWFQLAKFLGCRVVVPSPEGAQLISVSGCWIILCAENAHITYSTLHTRHGYLCIFSGFWQETNKTWSHQNGILNGGGCMCLQMLTTCFCYFPSVDMSFYVLTASCWGWNSWWFGCKQYGLSSSWLQTMSSC